MMQVEELRDMGIGKIPNRIRRHLLGTGILKPNESSADLAKLYGDYRDEWLEVTQVARKNGYSWTNMIDSKGGNRASA
jgi:hypothetical protein